MEKKKTLKNWVNDQKTELIVAGATVVTVVGAVLLAKNWDSVKALIPGENVQKAVTPSQVVSAVPVVPVVTEEPIMKIIDVREHLRTLPEGHHPSAWKVAKAAESGIELAANQTLVSAHPRCYAA